MLLAVDIGNSNIKFAVLDGSIVTAKLSTPSLPDAKPRAFIQILKEKLPFPVTRSLISSVVPSLNDTIKIAVSESYSVNARIIDNRDITTIDIAYTPIEAAGTDRLLNSLAAADLYGTPVIVCSMGTAFTIDYIDQDRKLVGGLIAPGLRILSRAFHVSTARLPEVTLENVDSVLQIDTSGSLRSGIINGFAAQVDGLIKQVKNEIGKKPLVVATGGDAQMIADRLDIIDIVDNDLLLKGIASLAEDGQV